MRRQVLQFQEVSEKFYTRVVSTSGLVKPGQAVSDEIRYAVESAASMFLKIKAEAGLADALNLSIGEGEYTGRDTCKIAALLITNACLLHRRLLDVAHMAGLVDLNDVAGSPDPIAVLHDAWVSILEKDYAPVFEPALNVTRALPAGNRMADEAIYVMADCANRIADSLSELGYDHSGPLYHDILGTAKSDSAFYTHNVSAVLLARLALPEDFADWGNPDAVGGLRIIDPACGTGTLLMAAMQAVKHRMSYDTQDGVLRNNIHLRLVEDVLCGLDINHHAIQLAACNLTLGAPTVDYKDMRLYTMPHGPQQRQRGGSTTTTTAPTAVVPTAPAAPTAVKAGSVEMLRAASETDTMQSFVQPLRNVGDLGGVHVDSGRRRWAGPRDLQLRGFDVVIMNPPFGSNRARSRKFPADVVRRMQQNELAIMKELTNRDPAAGRTIDVNSISTFVTPLADRLLDQRHGTLAKVMPVTACIGASGLEERRFLADRFWVERIITTHDPRRVNFSYKTSIHECLMVCRRWCPDNTSNGSNDNNSNGSSVSSSASSGGTSRPKPPTEFVSLRRMPRTAQEAAEAADAIAAGGDTSWGSTCTWPAEMVGAGDWTPAQWYDAGLPTAIHGLESSPYLEPVSVRHEVGPAGRRIHDAYEECKKGEPGSVMIFDSIGADLRRTIHGAPESHHRPKTGRRQRASSYWGMRSRLLVAVRFSTTSSRLAALCTDEPSVGKGWVPVSVKDRREAAALAVWWNSTPAIMMLLNRRSKKLTYPKWSLEHLREIRIPKPDSPGWSALYDTYSRMRGTEVQPLYAATGDPVREEIDSAAALALDMDPQILAGWRRRLSAEPTIASAAQS